jgi:raffinose/stachyose/melibiose transport system permease protein
MSGIKSREKIKNYSKMLVFMMPVLILYIGFFIYPIIFIFITSLTKWNGITAMEWIGFKNYTYLFTDSIFQLAIKNNIIWALCGGFILIPLAALVAFILARKPKGWKVLRTIYFLPNIISAVAIAMLWKAIYNAEYGALNAFLKIFGNAGHNWLGETATALTAIIVQWVLYIGYFMIIIFAATTSIPKSLYEAAEMDGASSFKQEIFITIPMIGKILITSVTLAMAYGMRHFEATFLMTRGQPSNTTTVLGLLLYEKMDAFRYGEANATGIILIIIGMVLIILLRKILSYKLTW